MPLEDRSITPSLHSNSTYSQVQTDSSVLEIVGRSPLGGHVKISGAKNAALVIMAGALLCADVCRLRNVPALADITTMGRILSALGLKIQQSEDVLDIDAREIISTRAPYDLVSQLRASFFALGPLLARCGVAEMPLPGGCAIGARPVDLHVRGLQSLGADVIIEHGVVRASIAGGRRLQGAKIHLDYPSVGATETLMMAATLADGETTIDNAAQEPEVVDLANFCRAMGARIEGAGTKTIRILGQPQLHGVEYVVVPDRIEAGTFLLAGAITRSEVSLSPIVPDHLSAVIAKLRETGCRVVSDTPNSLRILKADRLTAVDIQTQPFPGFPTDLQAPFMSLLTLCEGNSVVDETVFENRLQHVAELQRMGADIRVKGNIAVVSGVPILSGAPVEATDLRASAALVIAGLAADGTTIVGNLRHMDRGYENLVSKMQAIGAKITRKVI